MSVTKNTETKLIKAGIRLAKKYGLNFTVRQLCAESSVNLGLFHYYFKNKDNFDKEMLQAVYRQMLSQLSMKVSNGASPRDNIEQILIGLHHFAGENRMFLSSLIGNILSGNTQLLQFLTSNFTKHITLISHELKRARLSEKIKGQPLPALFSMIGLPVIVPQIAMGLLERTGTESLPFDASQLVQTVENEEQFRARINLILDGIFGE
jgi:AcrR family transcriptional regulator